MASRVTRQSYQTRTQFDCLARSRGLALAGCRLGRLPEPSHGLCCPRNSAFLPKCEAHKPAERAGGGIILPQEPCFAWRPATKSLQPFHDRKGGR
jgi:hypothetical protein